ncbi:hypothetical protein D8674_033808 [Pyrus ussuriensis x Pyrus communis]|uniref:Uncharacterized protein n=1 Tax=Pyrus ussuriensis x Pyrus communis TaxID=2448454 RepID=A0A5N5HQP6_9ROSA|nr:hypothetical protein D8674_033808 [Pyrus ussuriensis x Pyrus communis]
MEETVDLSCALCIGMLQGNGGSSYLSISASASMAIPCIEAWTSRGRGNDQ